MSRDMLSDLLRAVRLRGALFFFVEGADPGSRRRRARARSAPGDPAGRGALDRSIGVARGSCWAAIAGEEPIRLNEGDLVLFPQGDHHVMSSAPGLRAKAVDIGIYFAPRPAQLPFALNVDEHGTTTALLEGGGPERTTIVCGYLGCDAKPFNPLLASMPRVLHMPGVAAEGNIVDRDLLAHGGRGVESQAPGRRSGAQSA